MIIKRGNEKMVWGGWGDMIEKLGTIQSSAPLAMHGPGPPSIIVMHEGERTPLESSLCKACAVTFLLTRPVKPGRLAGPGEGARSPQLRGFLDF